MIRLALAQMRRSVPRLVSAGIAILIGTAFVAATLVAGNTITRTTYESVAASLADADLVVLAGPELTTDDVALARSVDGVAAADGRLEMWTEVTAGGRSAYPRVTLRASDDRLEAQRLAEGAMPTHAGETAVPVDLAERLDVGVGDTVTVVRHGWDEKTQTSKEDREAFAVVGLTEDPAGAFVQTEGAIIVTEPDVTRWWTQEGGPDGLRFDTVVVALSDGADVATVRAGLQSALGHASPQVLTKQERAEELTAEFTGDADAITGVVLGFAAVALLVAALVVANTFQVLVAQRTRTLALLRCVGAEKKQIRRSVLVEATLLGLVASAAGLATGLLLSQAVLVVLGNANPDVPLPAAVPVSPSVIAVPVLVGTVVTLVASLSPARAATRVAPLEALRPVEQPVGKRLAGRGRVVLSALLVVGGGALLGLGVLVSTSGEGVLLGLAAGILGGALSFVGVVVGAVLWIPRVVSVVGSLLATTGPSARLAAANTLRNPRRTAATSAALLIGVTLVAMMSTGAATARTTLGNELDAQFPVDVLVYDDSTRLGMPEDQLDPALTPAVVERLAAVDGVASAQEVVLAEVVVTGDGSVISGENARAVPADRAEGMLRVPDLTAGLAENTVVIGTRTAAAIGVRDGDPVTLAAGGDSGADVTLTLEGDGSLVDEDGSLPTTGATPVRRTAVVTAFPDGVIVTPATFAEMGIALPTNEVWLRLEADADTVAALDEVQEILSDLPVQVMGAARERITFEQVIDTMLAIIVGLLAAAVVIAVIGVANTLSLSVIERRRESATLRAIGLTRGQLRASLAVEGCLIAGVGALLGIVLGLAYGWIGSVTVLGAFGDVALSVAWDDMGLAFGVAIVAGLLASVLPARSAVRTSPVEALAVE